MTDISLWVFIGLCVTAALSGVFFGPGDWYRELAKPSWQPPDWLFGPAWTLLYAMMAVAAWWVWRGAGEGEAAVPITFWCIQLALNAAWSFLFFGMKRMDLALYECGFLWVAILLTIITFWRVEVSAALLLLPYLAWVSFAAFLNWTVLNLNRDSLPATG